MKRKILFGLLLFTITCGVTFAASLPKDIRQKLESVKSISTIYDRRGKLIGNLYNYQRIWAPIQKIDKDLQNAVVAIEDNRFYKHNGIDLKGMVRAFLANLTGKGNMQGGSTITQQLAKIVLLSMDRTLNRKIQDISYALEIEKNYTKSEILEMYLNSIYLAHGNLGVESAARFYFGKSARRLTVEEAAMIAAIIRSPENYSPVKHPEVAKKRRNLVLKKMFDYKYLTNVQYQAAIKKPIVVVGKKTGNSMVGGYFLDYIREYLIKQLGYTEEELRVGGYKIYTTLDLGYQKQAEQVMQNLPVLKGASVQPQGALITLDPNTGGILAMVGGKNYGQTQYNRAVKSYRQPGSAIKPFVYASALEKGYTAASVFEDKPLEIPLTNGRTWQPTNYDHTYRGKITLRQALRNSVNTVAVQLVQTVGIDAVVEQMERMGIDSLVKNGSNNDLNLAPLSLGGLTKGVTPLELAASYTTFPNQGNYMKPIAIRKILDGQGNLLKKFKAESKPALSATSAYIMTMLMKDVVEQGTAQKAQIPGWQVAGKTGTSSDYTNAWFVGFTPDLLTVVWLGNDRQGVPMKSKGVSIGSAYSAQLWSDYMKKVTVKRQVVTFKEPPGIVWADVNPNTGQAVPGWMKGDGYKEVFNKDNVPKSGAYKVWDWFFGGKKDKNQNGDVNNDQGAPNDQAPDGALTPDLEEEIPPGEDEVNY